MALPFGTAHIRELYRGYRRNAKRRGHSFELTIKDFRTIVVKYCHYCGAPPSIREYTMTKKKIPSNGIDRVNSEIGYTVDNCVPACGDCNKLKGTLSYDAFLALVRRIYEFTEKVPKEP